MWDAREFLLRPPGSVRRGLKFSRNVMPDIMRPSFQDAGPRHDVKAITGGVLQGVSIITNAGSGGGTYCVRAKHSWSIYGYEMKVRV